VIVSYQILSTITLLTFSGCFDVRENVEADKMNTAIEDELKTIQTPLTASYIRSNTVQKDNLGVVGKTYRTSLTYPELRTYYDAELERRGWRFTREKKLQYDHQDRGQYHVFYCKGKYTAHLEYAGGLEDTFGWTYSVAVSWGMTEPGVTCR